MREAELERIIGLYSATVYRTAYCRTGSAADAEDIMREAFLRLYTSELTFENDEHNPNAGKRQSSNEWLNTIANPQKTDTQDLPLM